LQQALDSLHYYKIRYNAQSEVLSKQWSELDKYKILYLEKDAEVKKLLNEFREKLIEIEALRDKEFALLHIKEENEELRKELFKKETEYNIFKEMIKHYMLIPDSIY